MFEQFVKRPFHRARYRDGPYSEKRGRFLTRLVQEGRCVDRLKGINWLLLEVAKRSGAHLAQGQQIFFDFSSFFPEALSRGSSSSHRDFFRAALIAWRALLLRYIDPIQHHGHLAGPQLKRPHSLFRPRQLKYPLLQPLVPQHKTILIPVQNFQSVAAPRAKYKKMPAQRIFANHRLHPLGQTVKPAAHVRRFHRQPDAHRLRPIERPQTRKPDHPAASATANNARTCSRSNPCPTTRLRPLRSRISTRASLGALGSGAAAATFTSTNPLATAGRPTLTSLAAVLSRSRFFHQ